DGDRVDLHDPALAAGLAQAVILLARNGHERVPDLVEAEPLAFPGLYGVIDRLLDLGREVITSEIVGDPVHHCDEVAHASEITSVNSSSSAVLPRSSVTRTDKFVNEPSSSGPPETSPVSGSTGVACGHLPRREKP